MFENNLAGPVANWFQIKIESNEIKEIEEIIPKYFCGKSQI